MPNRRPADFPGLVLENVPWLNLRLEFNHILALFRTQSFRDQFRTSKANSRIPIRAPHFTWSARPESLLTQLLRNAIVGLECAVSGAVFMEAISRGIIETVLPYTQNPFEFKSGMGTADKVFNQLPALIDETYAINRRAPELWGKLESFYRDVRNPLFHDSELSEASPEAVLGAFEFLWQVFEWLNSWHRFDEALGGIVQMRQPDALSTIPAMPDVQMRGALLDRRVDHGPLGKVPPRPSGLQAPDVADVLGAGVTSQQTVLFNMRTPEAQGVAMAMSPNGAMKMLAFLLRIQRDTGWPVPQHV